MKTDSRELPQRLLKFVCTFLLAVSFQLAAGESELSGDGNATGFCSKVDSELDRGEQDYQPVVAVVSLESYELVGSRVCGKWGTEYSVWKTRYKIHDVLEGNAPEGVIDVAAYTRSDSSPAGITYRYIMQVFYWNPDGTLELHNNTPTEPVRKSRPGNWGICTYDTVWDLDEYPGRARPMTFSPPWEIDVIHFSEPYIKRTYPEPPYERSGSSVLCALGYTAEDILWFWKHDSYSRDAFPASSLPIEE